MQSALHDGIVDGAFISKCPEGAAVERGAAPVVNAHQCELVNLPLDIHCEVIQVDIA